MKDVQISEATFLRCDEAPTPTRGALVHGVGTSGDKWEPGNVPEQEWAADVALSMGFDRVYLRGEGGTEQVITLQKVA
jgi:hypothetical protein